jgi:hypothetical protein
MSAWAKSGGELSIADQRMYRLYGLTANGIKMIEEATQR